MRRSLRSFRRSSVLYMIVALNLLVPGTGIPLAEIASAQTPSTSESDTSYTRAAEFYKAYLDSGRMSDLERACTILENRAAADSVTRRVDEELRLLLFRLEKVPLILREARFDDGTYEEELSVVAEMWTRILIYEHEWCLGVGVGTMAGDAERVLDSSSVAVTMHTNVLAVVARFLDLIMETGTYIKPPPGLSLVAQNAVNRLIGYQEAGSDVAVHWQDLRDVLALDPSNMSFACRLWRVEDPYPAGYRRTERRDLGGGEEATRIAWCSQALEAARTELCTYCAKVRAGHYADRFAAREDVGLDERLRRAREAVQWLQDAVAMAPDSSRIEMWFEKDPRRGDIWSLMQTGYRPERARSFLRDALYRYGELLKLSNRAPDAVALAWGPLWHCQYLRGEDRDRAAPVIKNATSRLLARPALLTRDERELVETLDREVSAYIAAMKIH